LKKRIPFEICFDEDGNVFEEDGELVKEVVGNAKKVMPNHTTFARNVILPIFFAVLMMGIFMPNLLVHQVNVFHGLFGFPRPLSLAKEVPLRNGDLNPRLDLL
jgi:hypothetical protein